MANLLDKHTMQILYSVNAPDYDARYHKGEQLPDDSRYLVANLLDFSAVSDVDRKFWKLDKGGVVPMTRAEQDAVLAAEKQAQTDAQVAGIDRDLLAAVMDTLGIPGKTTDAVISDYRAKLEAKHG